jgi:hypothetical protein
MPDPESIVESAAAMGVILYLDAVESLKMLGHRPPDWIRISASWLEQKAAIIHWLKTKPSHAHKIRIAKALSALSKARTGKPCLNLGPVIEAKPSCGCGARHQCRIHGECVVSGLSVTKWRSCLRCPDYQGKPNA